MKWLDRQKAHIATLSAETERHKIKLLITREEFRVLRNRVHETRSAFLALRDDILAHHIYKR
jgi:hypothetical protein